MSTSFDLRNFLPYQLAVLSERVSRRLAVEYEKLHGLNVAEWRILVHLQRLGPASVREIHCYTNLDKPKVSRAVARLEKNGLVSKETGESDGRLVQIALTREGGKALAEIIPVVSDVEAKLLRALSSDERQVFDEIMKKLHAVLDGDPLARPRPQLDQS